MDSSHVKNAYGRQGLGRSPVDRGRKGLKVSVLTDANGVVHNIRSDAANISDFHLFSPMLSSILINLRRIEVFADRGYDSKANRTIAYPPIGGFTFKKGCNIYILFERALLGETVS